MKKILVWFCSAFLISHGALAQAVTENGFSYNHLELGQVNYEVTGTLSGTAWEYNPSGPYLLGMMLVSEDVFIVAGAETVSSSSFTAGGVKYVWNVDISTSQFGVGYRFSTSKDVDLFVAGVVQSGKATATAGGTSYTVDASATPVYVGARVRLAPSLETDARLGIADGEAAFSINLALDLGDKLSAVIGTSQSGEDVTSTNIGLRFKF